MQRFTPARTTTQSGVTGSEIALSRLIPLEHIFGTYVATDYAGYQFREDAAAELLDPTYKNEQSIGMDDVAKKLLLYLATDHMQCNQRPEFGDKPQGATPETTAAIQQFKAMQDRANEIMNHMKNK